MKSIFFVTVVLITSVAFADDMTGVKAAADKFAAAWNKHDPKAMAATFTDDGDVINPEGRAAKGKAEIEALFADEHSGMLKNSKFELKVESMRVVDGLALCDGTATVTGIVGPDGKKMGKMDHHAFWVAKKSGDDWQTVALRPYMYVKMPPMKAPTKK